MDLNNITLKQEDYQVKYLQAKDEELMIYEYKKPLNNDETQKLNDFLQKIQENLKEEGLGGVADIIKDWKTDAKEK